MQKHAELEHLCNKITWTTKTLNTLVNGPMMKRTTPFFWSSHRPVSIAVPNSFKSSNFSFRMNATSNPRQRTAKGKTHLIYLSTVAVKEKIWLTFFGFLTVRLPRLPESTRSTIRAVLPLCSSIDNFNRYERFIRPLISDCNGDVLSCWCSQRQSLLHLIGSGLNLIRKYFSKCILLKV